MYCNTLQHTAVQQQYRVAKTHRMQISASGRSLSAKEPLIIGLFCGKWPVQIRHPMDLRHPVLVVGYHVTNSFIITRTHSSSHKPILSSKHHKLTNSLSTHELAESSRSCWVVTNSLSRHELVESSTCHQLTEFSKYHELTNSTCLVYMSPTHWVIYMSRTHWVI